MRRYMYDHPEHFILFAAGNDGYDDVPFGLGGAATSKNALVVGASEVAGSSPYGATLQSVLP